MVACCPYCFPSSSRWCSCAAGGDLLLIALVGSSYLALTTALLNSEGGNAGAVSIAASALSCCPIFKYVSHTREYARN